MSQIGHADKACKLTKAIEAVIDTKALEGKIKYKVLPYKEVEKLLTQFDVISATIESRLTDLKTAMKKTIYIIAVLQYIGIVSGVLAIILFVIKH